MEDIGNDIADVAVDIGNETKAIANEVGDFAEKTAIVTPKVKNKTTKIQ